MEKLGQSSTKQSLLQQESLLDFSKNVRLKNTTEQKNEKKKILTLRNSSDLITRQENQTSGFFLSFGVISLKFGAKFPPTIFIEQGD